MPVIRVEMLSGRSREQKKKLASSLTDAFTSATGAKPESVQVIFVDVSKDDWSVAGQLLSDRS